MRWETHTKEGTIQKKTYPDTEMRALSTQGARQGLQEQTKGPCHLDKIPCSPWRVEGSSQNLNDKWGIHEKLWQYYAGNNFLSWWAKDSTILFLNVLQMCRYWHHRSIYFGRRAKYRCAIFTFDLNQVYWEQKKCDRIWKELRQRHLRDFWNTSLHPISETKFHSGSAV